MRPSPQPTVLGVLRCLRCALCRPVIVVVILGILPVSPARAQVSVGYTTQTNNFNSLLTEKNNNPPYSGTYNNGATELANYANGGSFNNTPGAAAFETFTTTGNGNSGAVRALQTGDTFTITAFTSANPSTGGYLGISFRDSTTYANFFSATDNTTEARFQLDNTGGWKVYNAGAAVDSSLGANADRTFTIKITSDNTFNATVGGTTYYDLTMAAGGGKIDSFAIYTYGDSNQNSFWKNATLTSTGTVELGYAAAGGSTRTFSTAITDGLAANSTSTVSPNAVFIGGDAGSQVNLAASNSYTGLTTVNANARLEVQNAYALGGASNGTAVTSGGALSLYQATGGITIAGEALTLNGTGVNALNGALRNTGGTNAWNGAITIGSGVRINADTTGSSGSLTIGGNIAGGTNVLFLGALGSSGGNTGGNITVNGVISGSGNTQDGTATSVYKDGTGVLTFGGANNYTGDTRIAQGNLTVSGSGALGSGSDVFIASGASLTVGSSVTVASLQEWGTTNSGTASIGSGATLTVSGNNYSSYMNSIAGSGSLAKSGTGTMNLFGSQSYTGGTTVSGGKLSSGVSLASTAITVSGGTLETTAPNVLSDSATVSIGSGTLALGGNDTVGAVTVSGGTITIGTGSTLTVSGNSSISGTGKSTGGTLATTGGANIALANNASTTTSDISVGSGSVLSGTGGTSGKIGGAGLVSPGNSPGIIAANQIDLSSGIDFAFEFTASGAPAYGNAANSVNDVVHLLNGSAPFSGSFSSANTISFYFNDSALPGNLQSSTPTTYLGGFYVDNTSFNIASLLGSGISKLYYIANANGTTTFNGVKYNALDPAIAASTTFGNVVQINSGFDTGLVDGTVLGVTVVPEPSTWALLVLGASVFAVRAIRFRRS